MRALLTAIFCFLCVLQVNGQDYLVTLKIVEGERSKDSHSKISEYKIDGMEVTVNESFTGMLGKEQGQSFSYTLKKGDFQRIAGYIEKLFQETTVVPYEKDEAGSYILVDLAVINKEDRTIINMHGRPDVIKDIDLYKKISKIAEDIKTTIHCYE